MKYVSIVRVICLVAILSMVGCTGQAFDIPITTQQGLSFMSSKRIPGSDLSDLDTSLTERSDKNSESNTDNPESIVDCPADRLDNVEVEGI